MALAAGSAACSGGSEPPPPSPPTAPPALPAIPPPARPAPRAVSAAAGTCDGILDFGPELRVAAARVVGRTYPDPATVELDLELDVQNTGPARFRSASVLPDLSGAADLAVVQSPPPLAADLGALEPGATATSTAALRLRLPASAEAELLRRLVGGVLPLHAQADEENVLAPGVTVRPWSPVEDRMYDLGTRPTGGFGVQPNTDPGPGPFLPGQEFTAVFLEVLDDTRTVFDDFVQGQVLYLVEDAADPRGGPLTFIHAPLRRVRVVDAVRYDGPGDGYTVWVARLRLTNDESLPAIYRTASHCTGKLAHIDPAVQASRVRQHDGRPVPDKERDANGQPLRLNKFVIGEGAVTFSGQIGGHVLKPSLQFKVREAHLEVGADFENELSVAGQLRAVAQAPEEVADLLSPAPAPVFVPLCFPLPPLQFVPLNRPMSLKLSQLMGMSGFIGGGVEFGFQKRFVGGLTIRCQLDPGTPPRCTSSTYQRETPGGLTPPRLFEKTGYEFKVTASFQAQLFVHDDTCTSGDGVSLDVDAFFRFGVSPAVESWWYAGAGVELRGALQMEALGFDLARWPVTLAVLETSLPGAESYPASSDPVGQRRSGDDQRWSVAIDDPAVPNGVNWSRIAALPGGASLVLGTEPVGGRNPLLKLDPSGSVLWVKEFSKKVLRLHALPDGSALVVGAPSWLARVDGDGHLLWSHDADLGRAGDVQARCKVSDAAALERAPGRYDYVAVGLLNTTADGCALRVDDDGTVAWTRIYRADGNQRLTAATSTRDGLVAAVGRAEWQHVGPRWAPWIAKIDPASGELVWSKRLPMTRLAELEDVVESADGTLFAAGHATGTLYSTGAALVARIAADGSDARHALYFEDADWEAALDGPWTIPYVAEPWIDTAGGETPYDGFTGIAPSGDGYVVVGTTGLGTDTAARAVRVNRNLGVEWMAVFDGASTDGFTGVAATGEGILVAGFSASLPQANGGSGDNQIWVAKLPHSGVIDFPADVPVTTRYSSPGTRASSSDPGVNPLSDAAIDAPTTSEELLLLSGGPDPGLLVDASPYCTRLLTATGRGTVDGCTP
jgi:hypothetical protein